MLDLQAKISEMPSCLPIPLAVRTAVKKESSLTVFDFCRATVIVRPRECLVCSGLDVVMAALEIGERLLPVCRLLIEPSDGGI
jgi:hypothetical protein